MSKRQIYIVIAEGRDALESYRVKDDERVISVVPFMKRRYDSLGEEWVDDYEAYKLFVEYEGFD